MVQRILFLCGIKTSSRVLNNWEKMLQKEFPSCEHIFLGSNYYNLSDTGLMKEIVSKASSIIKDKKETYIIAHSFDGILTGSILNNCKKHNISKILTFGSPHKMTKYGIKKRKQELNYTYKAFKDIKTITLGGYFDTIVPKSLTSLPFSIHKNFLVEHFIFFFGSKRFIRKCITLLKN